LGTFVLVLQDTRSRLSELEARFPEAISTGTLRSALDELRSQSALLENQIKQVISNPSVPITIGQLNGSPFVINEDTLRNSDQLLAALLNALSETATSSRTKGSPDFGPTSEDPCITRTRDLAADLLHEQVFDEVFERNRQNYNQALPACGAERTFEVGKIVAEWAGVVAFSAELAGVEIGLQASAALTYLALAPPLFTLVTDAQIMALGQGTRQVAENARDALDKLLHEIVESVATELLKALSPSTALAFKAVKATEFVSGELTTALASIRFDLFFPPGGGGALTGNWSGNVTRTDIACDYSGSMTMMLMQVDPSVTGPISLDLRLVTEKRPGFCSAALQSTASLSGTFDGTTFKFSVGTVYSGSATVSGSTMIGTATTTSAGITTTDNFTLHRN
jgi:hypothetical protein